MLSTVLHNFYGDYDFQITEAELDEFVHFCVDVFVSCEEQLPVELVVFMDEANIDIETFFDVGIRVANTVKIIRIH